MEPRQAQLRQGWRYWHIYWMCQSAADVEKKLLAESRGRENPGPQTWVSAGISPWGDGCMRQLASLAQNPCSPSNRLIIIWLPKKICLSPTAAKGTLVPLLWRTHFPIPLYFRLANTLSWLWCFKHSTFFLHVQVKCTVVKTTCNVFTAES